ncbi:MAG: potassium-transporting ATPase subunit [Rhodospirillales bacterium]|nr:potassium-transporting ATPase subunit [Rhodospirillales bacterium]
MMQALRMAVLMLAVMTVITGLAYPLAITGVAQLIFPHEATGSLIKKGDAVIGSSLIGQYFSKPEYFHPRPSAANAPSLEAGAPPAIGYDPLDSGATNLAPSSKKLIENVTAAVKSNQPDNPGRPVPGDLVTASASGLDPDITPDAAEFQVPRVALARNMSEDQVRAMVAKCTKGRTLGFLGEPRTNVLALNLMLDEAAGK